MCFGCLERRCLCRDSSNENRTRGYQRPHVAENTRTSSRTFGNKAPNLVLLSTSFLAGTIEASKLSTILKRHSKQLNSCGANLINSVFYQRETLPDPEDPSQNIAEPMDSIKNPFEPTEMAC